MSAVAPASVLWPNASGQKLRVVRDPSLRVRQAVRDNNVALLARLQAKADLRNTDKNRLTSLSWAAIEGSLEAFEWLLLDYGHDDQELSRDADNNTILHLLASVPAPPTLSAHTHLLKSTTSLPPAPRQRSAAELQEVSLRMTQLYHTLFPFLLDWSNSGGKTALHVAAQAGNTPFIALLCDLGADVDLTDLQGNTPLHFASAWGHLDSIRCLLERGCQFASRNFEGFTASDFAYSQQIMTSLQSIAREVFEERRNKRRELVVDPGYFDARGGSGGSGQSGTESGVNRMRSDSFASGSTSVHSGSAVSSNPSSLQQQPPRRIDSLPSISSPHIPSAPPSMSPPQPPSAMTRGSTPPVASGGAARGLQGPVTNTSSRRGSEAPVPQSSQASRSGSFGQGPRPSASSDRAMPNRSPPPQAINGRWANPGSPPPPVPPLPVLGPAFGATPSESTAPGPPQLTRR